MSKRSTKFYRKNEQEVMRALGLRPTKNSGSGWVEKEDGQNDYLICQLKSTDAQSIRVHQNDIRILEHNATVAHKTPIFAIQFLNTGEVWLMAKPEDFTTVAEYIETGQTSTDSYQLGLQLGEEQTVDEVMQSIKSAADAREQFHAAQRARYNKTKSAR